MKNILFGFLLFFSSIHPAGLFAQQTTFNKDHTTGLKIGEQVPEEFMQQEMLLMEDENGNRANIRLQDFKGKLIILDFWSIWCSSCIAAFPKVEALQKEFPNDIKLLLVNRDPKLDIEKRFKSLRKKTELPDITTLGPEAYTELSYLFPHRTVPHHVWIDGEGKVIAITNGYNATSENVKKYLAGDFEVLFQKVDHQDRSILHKDPVLKVFADEGKLATSQYMSWLSPREALFGNVIAKIGFVDSVHQTYRMSFPNYSVIDLLRIAFSAEQYKDMQHFNANARIRMNFPDSARFMRRPSLSGLDDWAKEMEHTYEQIIPLSDTVHRFTYMQQDLNRYFGSMFGLKTRVEEQEVTAIVATANEKRMRKLAKEHANREAVRMDPMDELQSSKRTASQMLSSLYYFTSSEILKDGHFPFVNELSLDPTLVFTLKKKYTDFETLKKDLEEYGIVLSKAPRKVSMLVIERNLSH